MLHLDGGELETFCGMWCLCCRTIPPTRKLPEILLQKPTSFVCLSNKLSRNDVGIWENSIGFHRSIITHHWFHYRAESLGMQKASDPIEQISSSAVQLYKEYEGECSYCSRAGQGRVAYGMQAKQIRVSDYQQLIDRGWRRTGSWVYQPSNSKSCCPHYTVGCTQPAQYLPHFLTKWKIPVHFPSSDTLRC